MELDVIFWRKLTIYNTNLSHYIKYYYVLKLAHGHGSISLESCALISDLKLSQHLRTSLHP